MAVILGHPIARRLLDGGEALRQASAGRHRQPELHLEECDAHEGRGARVDSACAASVRARVMNLGDISAIYLGDISRHTHPA